jgi:dolichyl-phosphate beta-glucosyltransferase
MNDIKGQVPLTLVIPCYNESDRIGLMYDGIRSFIEKWESPFEVIIINDGSKDNTEQLLTSNPVYLQNKGVISVYSQQNTGKGGALRNGVQRANGKHILTLDADMATPPEQLLKWLNLLGGSFADNTIYIGSREHKDSIIKKTGNRKVAGNIFNVIVQALTPLKMRDTQCGFKLYPGEEAKRVFADLQTYGWAHDVEVLYKAKLDGVKIVEMPVEWNAIEGSKINVVRDGIRMLREVMTIVARTKRMYKRK